MKKPPQKSERRGRAKVATLEFDVQRPEHRAYLNVRTLQLSDAQLDYLMQIITDESKRREKLRKKVHFSPEQLTKAVWL